MKNEYLRSLDKLEFVVTNACTGRCKHCSEGEHKSCGVSIDPKIAADAVRKIAAVYDIKTVMTFGGEPLLYADTVYEIMRTAKELGIPKRQVITNGYFSKSREVIRNVAEELAASGVNDLLLSVDAFHQETIPLDTVRAFATELTACGVPTRLQPAWLISGEAENPYNIRTAEILSSFSELNIPIGEGNVIFPEGNALRYLSEYFTEVSVENPYVEDPKDIRCLSFSADGGLLNGNIYESDVMDILRAYAPEEK